MSKRSWALPLVAIAGVLLYRQWRKGAFQGLSTSVTTSGMPSAAIYDFWAHLLLGGFYDRIAREVGASCSRGALLDVGPGPGLLDVRLAQIAPELAITGVDVAPDMAERATANAAGAGVDDRVRFEVGDVGQLPFPDAQFDIVISTFSMHHWPDPERGLAEIHRVLRPGGQARIYDLPEWFQRLTHHGPGKSLVEMANSSPFGGGVVAVFRWPDRLPTGQCLWLRKAAEGEQRTV